MNGILEIRLKGGLLLGGSSGAGLHDATLRHPDGVPYLPASALKGTLREQLARLVPEDRVRRILGGPGVGPLPDDDDQQPAAERPGGGSTRVFLGDGELVDDKAKQWFQESLGYASKIQVSIDRRSGRSAHEHLFQREIVAPFAETLRFHAEADCSLLDDQERTELEAAVTAVFALGASRTSGLGKVEMQLLRKEREDAALTVPEADTLEVVLEAIDPLCLGADRFLGNFRRSDGFVPGSALRGAVASAALRTRGLAGEDQSDQPWFRRLLLDPETCLRFSDALPAGRGRPAPFPTTLRTCKVGDQKHGVTDTLIRGYFRTLLIERGVFAVPEDTCRECGERLVPSNRPLDSGEPERRVVTRLGLDGASGRGADGQLFSVELIERGSRFVATVTGLDAEGRSFLADAARGVLRLGRGRGQGYGRVAIEVLAAPPDDLCARLERFGGWVRDGLERLAASLDVDPESFGAGKLYLAVTLLSDLVPGDHRLKAEDALAAALDLDRTEPIYGQVRTGQRGGWDARKGAPKTYRPTLRAGSSLLLRSAANFDELRPRLAHLEARGAGEAREEGLGWVRFSVPVHSPEWRSHDA